MIISLVKERKLKHARMCFSRSRHKTAALLLLIWIWPKSEYVHNTTLYRPPNLAYCSRGFTVSTGVRRCRALRTYYCNPRSTARRREICAACTAQCPIRATRSVRRQQGREQRDQKTPKDTGELSIYRRLLISLSSRVVLSSSK
jgi:hypothetical protein